MVGLHCASHERVYCSPSLVEGKHVLHAFQAADNFLNALIFLKERDVKHSERLSVGASIVAGPRSRQWCPASSFIAQSINTQVQLNALHPTLQSLGSRPLNQLSLGSAR